MILELMKGLPGAFAKVLNIYHSSEYELSNCCRSWCDFFNLQDCLVSTKSHIYEEVILHSSMLQSNLCLHWCWSYAILNMASLKLSFWRFSVAKATLELQMSVHLSVRPSVCLSQKPIWPLIHGLSDLDLIFLISENSDLLDLLYLISQISDLCSFRFLISDLKYLIYNSYDLSCCLSKSCLLIIMPINH